MSDPTYREMIEDVCAWGRAGYPEVACGRYQDAAERIKRLESELAECKQDAERYRWLKTHGEVWGGVPEIGPPGEFMWRWRWTLTRAQYDQNRVDSLTTAIDVARARYQSDAVKASILPKADRWYEPR